MNMLLKNRSNNLPKIFNNTVFINLIQMNQKKNREAYRFEYIRDIFYNMFSNSTFY